MDYFNHVVAAHGTPSQNDVLKYILFENNTIKEIIYIEIQLLKYFFKTVMYNMGFPGGSVVLKKKSICQSRRFRFSPWVGKIPWRTKWQATPIFLPGESLGWRSLAGYNLWRLKKCRIQLCN